MTDRRTEPRSSAAAMPESTYVELVRSLFSGLVPPAIMTISFAVVGLLILCETPDMPLAVLLVAGVLAAAARILIVVLGRPCFTGGDPGTRSVRKLERAFGAIYLSFAVALGLFTARALLIGILPSHVLIVGLLFGYGAGVAAGVSLRPWISVPAMIVAILPTLAAAVVTPDATLRAFAALLAVFTAGGIQSMLARYRGEVSQIGMRQLFATLARRDELTGLPNRLSLRESFVAAREHGGTTFAVHCLDLDRFKPVNDRFGHPVGDAVLKQVAARLAALLRRSDFAARVGGDEFVVVQTGIGHEGEADMLARRIVRAVSQPYEIEGRSIEIGTSVGYALSADYGDDLDRLLGCADQALYEAKRTTGIAAHRETAPAPPGTIPAPAASEVR